MKSIGNVISTFITLIFILISVFFWAPLAIMKRSDYIKSIQYNNEVNANRKHSQVNALNWLTYTVCFGSGISILYLFKDVYPIDLLLTKDTYYKDAHYCYFWIKNTLIGKPTSD